MSRNEIQYKIFSYLTMRFYLDDYKMPEILHTPIMELGIDSVEFFEVIEFLEEKYQISISDAEIKRDNLEDIDKMSIFILKKTSFTKELI